MKNTKTHLLMPCKHLEYDIEFERMGDIMFFQVTCRVCKKSTPLYGATGIDFSKPGYGIPEREIV